MANPEHLEIFKQGVQVWNQWRKDNPDIKPDLSRIEYGIFYGMEIHEFVNEVGINFAGVDCSYSLLYNIDFTSANFTGADLEEAKFWITDFTETNLSNSILIGTTFRNALLRKTNMNLSILGETIFSDCDLNDIRFEKIYHQNRSTVGIDTINRSGGNIPEVFLRGCGVPETFITYAKSLINNPIDFYSCFISFTEKDDAFSERLYNDMQMAGIRCWRWKEDAKWGRTLRKEIDEAVRYYDKLVVICSKESLKAPAVLEEIERALDKEDAQRRAGDEGEVLFPIAIDRYIFDEWEHELKIRLMRKTIGNFYDCGSDLEKYRRSVERLVKDLNRPRADLSPEAMNLIA